jgi:hypothetical protein
MDQLEPSTVALQYTVAAPLHMHAQELALEQAVEAMACLYLRGNCFRMSRTEEMAYSPVSSVKIMTKLVVLPAPDTAKKNCTQNLIVNTSCCSVQRYDSVYCFGAFLCCF